MKCCPTCGEPVAYTTDEGTVVTVCRDHAAGAQMRDLLERVVQWLDETPDHLWLRVQDMLAETGLHEGARMILRGERS